MLGTGWGVGKDAGVICILQEVHLVVGVGEVVSQVNPGLEGVNKSVDDRIPQKTEGLPGRPRSQGGWLV